MNVFVIDTSMELGTVGITLSGSITIESQFQIQKGSTNTVHSYIKKVFKDAALKPEDLNLIGVVIGPGSFTGLRVALSAAKGLAHPFTTPIVGIESTLAIAERIKNDNMICVLIDARRSQFYRAVYERDSENLQKLSGPEAVNDDIVLKDIPPGAVITGPGVRNLNEDVLKNYIPAVDDLRFPTARELSKIAQHLFENKRLLDLSDSTPSYIRRPDAMI